jgi:hypothetical protein
MPRLYVQSILTAALIACSPDSLQEAISGCEITKGAIPCFNLKSRRHIGYSPWEDPYAANDIKCPCREDKYAVAGSAVLRRSIHDGNVSSPRDTGYSNRHNSPCRTLQPPGGKGIFSG